MCVVMSALGRSILSNTDMSISTQELVVNEYRLTDEYFRTII